MERFTASRHAKFIEKLPFSYFSCIPYLEYSGFFEERNGEPLVFEENPYVPGTKRSIFAPSKPENLHELAIMFASKNDTERIRTQHIPILEQSWFDREYFYETTSLANPKGRIRQQIARCESEFSPKLLTDYPIEKIREFHAFWLSQRTHPIPYTEGHEFFEFCLARLNEYGVTTLYTEIDGKLAGLAWGIPHQAGWVALHLKVNYEYPGLSLFMIRERAKRFADRKLVTTGTDIGEPGIRAFKSRLHPAYTIDYENIRTGTCEPSKHVDIESDKRTLLTYEADSRPRSRDVQTHRETARVPTRSGSGS